MKKKREIEFHYRTGMNIKFHKATLGIRVWDVMQVMLWDFCCDKRDVNPSPASTGKASKENRIV